MNQSEDDAVAILSKVARQRRLSGGSIKALKMKYPDRCRASFEDVSESTVATEPLPLSGSKRESGNDAGAKTTIARSLKMAVDTT